MNCSVPLIGDFHFNGHKLLSEYPDCAQALSKYRINPGNVGKGAKRDDQFGAMIEAACKFNKPVRIGVNWGSLDQELLARLMDDNSKRAQPWDAQAVMREALVTSAIDSAQQAEKWGLAGDRITLSAKVSSVQDLISVYRELARRCDYPLHLGLTEAGMGSKGIVASTAAMAVLLQEGIGHHPGLAHPRAWWRSPIRGHRRPGDVAIDGDAGLCADGRSLPWLWANDFNLLSRARLKDSVLSARSDACLENPVSRR